MKKNILILGSSGFIGNNLRKKLKSKYKIFCSHNNKKKRIININEKKKLEFFINKNKINFIINLINNSNFKKIYILNKKIIKILNNKKINIIYVSSCLAYGQTKSNAGEMTKLKPFDRYTKSKARIENLYKLSNLKYKILRLSNVYDNNLNKKGLFKNIKDCLENKNLYISFNNLNIYRNFIHINNACSLFERLINKYEKINSKIINLGAENIKLSEIIKIYNKKFNNRLVVKINKIKKFDPSIKINNRLSKKELNFINFIKLKNTINKLYI